MAVGSHPEGETLLARGAGLNGLIQMVRETHPATQSGVLILASQISTNASAPLSDIIGGATSKEQSFFMQLYVDRQRHKSEELIRKIESFDQLKAIFVTVDAAAPGKREADERARADIEVVSV